MKAPSRRVTKAAGRAALIALPLLAAGAAVSHGPGLAKAAGHCANLNPAWTALAVAAMAAVYSCTWAAISAASGTRLPWGRTMAVQLAGVYLNRVVPAGVASKLLNVRYLSCSGVEGASAVAAMGSVAAGSAIAGTTLAFAAGAFLAAHGDIRHVPVRAPGPGWIWTICALIAVLAGVALVPAWRRRAGRLLGHARMARIAGHTRPLFCAFRHQRRRILATTAILAAERIAYGLVFLALIRAAGGAVPVAVGVCVYLFSSLAGATVPVAGGLGAVEAALTMGLHSAGMHPAAAAATAIAFRLVSYWGPAAPGVIAYRALRRAHAI